MDMNPTTKHTADKPVSQSGSYYHSDWSFESFRKRSVEEDRRRLKPLIEQIKTYDLLRYELENYGGDLVIFNRISKVLSQKFAIKTDYYDYNVSLIERYDIKSALHQMGYDYILDVRRLDHSLPVYYLCRVHSQFYSNYSLIVDDIYISKGYPMHDKRFVKLMRAGHETHYLRLSPFRKATAQMLNGEKADDMQVDNLLLDLGNYIFEAAWHEDQRPGILAAEVFGMPNFRNAIELLYLCLTSELCDLRSQISPDMLRFFREVYPQPAIYRFLKKLDVLVGSEINNLPEKVMPYYAQLSRAFSRFLQTEIAWGSQNEIIPLYKLIFANFNRLEIIAKKLTGHQAVMEEVKSLDSKAKKISASIIKE
jgi:hypothetical protein